MRQVARFPRLQTMEVEFAVQAENGASLTLQAPEGLSIEAFGADLQRILAQYPASSTGTWVLAWEQEFGTCSCARLAFCSKLDELLASESGGDMLGRIGQTKLRLTADTGLVQALFHTNSAQALQSAWDKFCNRFAEEEAEAYEGGKGSESEQAVATESQAGTPQEAEAFEATLEAALEQLASVPTPSAEGWKGWEAHQLEVAFKAGRELVQRLAADVDFTERCEGGQAWDAGKLAKMAVGMQYTRLTQAKYAHPKSGLVLLLDISGSCSEQAEMFAAIAAGAVGDGVEVWFSLNGEAMASPLQVRKGFGSYSQAKAWVKREVERIWKEEWLEFETFLQIAKPARLVIFGDWDGKNLYEQAARKRPRHSWYWFCNETRYPNSVPTGWSKRNYVPNVLAPQALVRALKNVR